jgi:hypothetical protein
MTLALLSHFDRHPIHAAAVARDGRSLLLAGPSGTGKSTVAYAAHSDGFGVLGEDHVWVAQSPTLRVWGWPGRILLRPEVASIFPEVARFGAAANANGIRKLAYDLDPSRSASPYVADDPVVCILDRGHGDVKLERLGPAALVEALTTTMTPGFDRFPERHESVVRALTKEGGWRLTLSGDPREAVPFLRTMIEERKAR